MVKDFPQRLAAIEAQTRDVFGPHNARMAALVERLGQTSNRPAAGDRAPDFALPNAEGGLVALSQLLDRRALALVFIRGLWCPYCNAQMQAIVELSAAFEEAGLRVAVVTPEVGGRARQTRESLGLTCEVLCDVDEGVALSYGCLFHIPPEDQAFLTEAGYPLNELYGNDGWFMPLASTFLIGADGVIRQVYGEADQRKRTNPAVVLADAQRLL